MALNVYYAAQDSSIVLVSNPLSVSFDGRTGGAQCRKVYVRNDDPARWYTNITIQVQDSGSPSLVDGLADGWQIKLSDEDTALTEEQWGLVAAGNTLSLGSIGTEDIGDIVTYIPVWVRFEVPRAQTAQNITRLSFLVNAQEGLV